MTLRIFSGVKDTITDDLVGRATEAAGQALRPVAQVVDQTTDAVFATSGYLSRATDIPFVGPPVSPIDRIEQASRPTVKAEETKTTDNTASPDAMAMATDRLYTFGDPAVYDNILSEYHSPIANWRFFVTSDAVLKNSFADTMTPSADGSASANYYEILQDVDQITLIETGVTGYNIKEVVVETKIGTTLQNRAMNALSFIVRVTEPYGTTLMDSIIHACTRLNVPNWRLAPFHLELTFKGIHPTTGMPKEIPYRRIWAVAVHDITCTFDTGTVNYEILLRPYNHVAFDHAYATLKKNEGVVARTLGEALGVLCQHLTENPDRKEAGGFQKNYVKYKYKFHAETLKNLQGSTDPDAWVIAPNMWTGESLAGGFKVEDAGSEKTVIHFGANTRFEQAIELLIAVTREGHNMLGIDKANQRQAAETQQETPEPGSNTIGQSDRNEFYIFRIDPQVKLLGFNRLTGDYNKEITYHIYFFEFNTLTLDREHVSRLATRPGQEERWKKIAKRINKRYDYTYTGLNTEVIDLRMELNMLWKVALPFNSGQYDFSLIRDGRYLNEANWKDVVEARALRRYITLANEQKILDRQVGYLEGTVGPFTAEQTEQMERRQTVLREKNAIEIDPEQALTISRALDTVADSLKPTFAGEDPIRQGGDIGTTVVASQPRLTPSNQRHYGEDLIGTVSSALVHNNNNLLGSLMVAFSEESARESPTGTHLQIEGEHQPERTLFGNLLNQVFSPGKDFLLIELQIRGDPWWLGADTYQIQHFSATGGQSTQNAVFMTIRGEQPTANFLEHSHMFLLRFGTPVGYDSATGLPQVRPGGMFEGVYEVIEVRNHFDEQGKFTQILKAKRDNGSVITPLTSGDKETIAAAQTRPGVPSP